MKAFKINYESEYPIYYQLYGYLKEAILNGEYRPGDCVPSESKMMEEYGVSRITVRHAIADLEHDGLLKRYRGKGSVVLEGKSTNNLNKLYSFSESAYRRGERISYIIISSSVRSPDIKIARALNIPISERVFELKRLFLLNGRIAGMTNAYLPYWENKRELFKDFDETTSLFKRLMENDVSINYAEETLEVIQPSADIRRALYLDDSVPVVYSEHQTYDADGNVIVYTESHIAANKFKYTITIKRF